MNKFNNIPVFIEYNSFKDRIIEAIKQQDWGMYLCLFGNCEKLEAFLFIEDMIKDKAIAAELFRDVWETAELNFLFAKSCAESFIKYKDLIMTKKEKKVYDSLPDTLTIYRGTRVPKEVDSGISWTLDKKIAKKFNIYPSGKYLESKTLDRTLPFVNTILEKQVNKEDIICYLNGRNEKEVIYLGKKPLKNSNLPRYMDISIPISKDAPVHKDMLKTGLNVPVSVPPNKRV